MRYEEVLPIGREDAERVFASDDARAISSALVSVAFFESDWRWVESLCLRFAGHDDPALRAVAATCLGHLARIHGVLDLDLVKPVLHNLLSDEGVSGYAEDALADIRMFLPTTRSEIEEALASGDSAEICEALRKLVHQEFDLQCVLTQCQKFAKHENAEVRRAATANLGYLPLYYAIDDYEPILATLNGLLQDQDVAEQAKEALSIINRSIAEQE